MSSASTPAPDAGTTQPTPTQQAAPRAVALVGPYGSGKSALFDALLTAAGAPPKRAADPRERQVGTEMRIAHASFLGDPWALIDCPGSIEFAHETACALSVADLAVVVCEPDPARALTVAPALHQIEALGLPYLVFVNKIDTLATDRVRDTLAALQAHAARPLVLRQVPIREGEAVTGYVDIVSERAYRYRQGAASELIALPEHMRDREKEAQSGLLEVLADHDDALLEKIVEDIAPTTDEIYRQLHKDLAAGALTPVLLGAAERAHGIRRLWKALRHDTPSAEETEARRGVPTEGPPLAQVFKTVYAGHAGKLSWVRAWRGPIRDGSTVAGSRIGGIHLMPGGEDSKVPELETGAVGALGRLDNVTTGTLLGTPTPEEEAALRLPDPPHPVYSLAIATQDRKDDVRLSGALARLIEEDPSLTLQHDKESGEHILHGQGEIHLNAALERLARASNIRVSTHRPRVPFRETIRSAVHQHARLKRQTGGHGQFADVKFDIAPRPRGAGFQFVDKIVGGAVPRQYIPAVGEAAEEATARGPLGYPVVDVVVTLTDGQFHSVDSSDMAFRSATRQGMTEALAKADPILLEPIDHVTVSVPQDFTASAQRLLTGRRGQILGYEAKNGWPGWDDVEALVPQAELHDLIIELRSLTMGLGAFRRQFDHLAEAHHRNAIAAAAAGAKEGAAASAR